MQPEWEFRLAKIENLLATLTERQVQQQVEISLLQESQKRTDFGAARGTHIFRSWPRQRFPGQDRSPPAVSDRYRRSPKAGKQTPGSEPVLGGSRALDPHVDENEELLMRSLTSKWKVFWIGT